MRKSSLNAELPATGKCPIPMMASSWGVRPKSSRARKASRSLEVLLAPVRLIELMSACTSGVMTSAFGPGETVGWVEAPFAGAVVPGDGAGAALVGGDGGAVVGMGRPDRWVVVVVAKVGGGWGGGRVVVVESPGAGVCVVVC